MIKKIILGLLSPVFMIMGIILIIGAGAGAALGSSPIFFFSGQL
jgi:hypothetical protein